MKGQLWQECPACRTRGEVACCLDCERCAAHCPCIQEDLDAATIRAFERRFPGFLQKLYEHHEQGAREH
jgi:hypothetical protein